MGEAGQQFRERLEAFAREYRRQLPQRLREVKRAWNQALVSEDREQALGRLHGLVHGLAASGGTFGCDALSQAAHRLELFLKAVMDEASPLSPTREEQINAYLTGVTMAINGSPECAAEGYPEPLDEPDAAPLRPEKLVFLAVEDAPLARELSARIEQAGYAVRTFDRLEALRPALAEARPVALVADLEFGGTRAIREFNTGNGQPVPILFISGRGEFAARLAAVRAGGTHYFTTPVDAERLIATIGELTEGIQPEPYRILIVEDDPELASIYRFHLEHAGMAAQVAGDAFRAAEALDSFRPELILMDVHLPGCSGLELAATIRQQDRYAHIPIVFLSTEASAEWQPTAPNLDGDECLTKPVKPRRLLATVRPRVKRARSLARLSSRALSTLRELERQKFAQDESRERMRLAQLYADVGTWDWNIATGELHWSERIAPLFGGPAGDLETTYESFLNAVHPDDRQIVADAVRACVERGAAYDIEHRVLWPDGTVRWLHGRGGVSRDGRGRPSHMLGVVQDVTRRKLAEDDLIRARDEAERTNRAKSEFLSRMSHELRTPMNVILGFAQLLESDPGAPLAKPQEDSVQQILKAGWHLLQLINEVLDLARIEAGRIELSLENVNLVEVLDECRAHITPLAERRGIALHEQTGDAVSCLVHADRTRLKQVLLNLLTNAVKYNRDGGSISLALEFPAEDRVRLKVADTGIGLTEAQQGRLFEPFNRLGAERSEVEGCGIGLTIVRHLMELMGGGIGVESAPGTGSTFWIDLGLGAEAHLPDEARAARPATPGQEALPQRTVLYVEDNPANLKLVAQLLARRPDLRLISTHSADLGLEMARAQRPDLIILDINLPGMDGFEARARLRLYPETAEIPVIALSASAMPKDVERGLAAGFLRYLTKPIRIDRFLRTLDDILDDIQPAGRVPAQHESAGT